MSARRLPLGRLSRAEAVTARSRSGLRAPLQFATRPWTLSADGGARDMDESAWNRITLREHGERIEVVVPSAFVATLLGERAPEADPFSLDPELTALLLEWTLLPEIEAWEGRTGRRLSFVGFEAANRLPAKPDRSLHLTLHQGSVLWPVTVLFPEDASGTAPYLSNVLERWPIAGRQLTRLTVPVRLRLGATDLPLAVSGSLRVGDAIRLQYRAPEDAVLVVSEFLTAPLRREDGSWRLMRAPHRMGDRERMDVSMTQDAHEDEAIPLATIEAIPVRLTFDVGSLDIELGALRKLGAGAVLELGRALPELVRINANGRLFGHGELVEVEGVPAVRILRLLDHA